MLDGRDSCSAGTATRPWSKRFMSEILIAAAAVFDCPSDIKKSEADLEQDEGVCPVMETPHNPKQVTEQEDPKAPVSLKLSLRSYLPRSEDRNGHRRPLQRVDPVHSHLRSLNLPGLHLQNSRKGEEIAGLRSTALSIRVLFKKARRNLPKVQLT